MQVRCRSNLDLQGEQWPDDMPCCPRVGDRIRSCTRWDNRFQLELEVVSITWVYADLTWMPVIELHYWQKCSLKEFYDWYAPRVGKTTGCFI